MGNSSSRLAKLIGSIRKLAQRKRAERRAKAGWTRPANPLQPQLRPAFALARVRAARTVRAQRRIH
jgi:hypothetical protein